MLALLSGFSVFLYNVVSAFQPTYGAKLIFEITISIYYLRH
jgi:hypothetical protein